MAATWQPFRQTKIFNQQLPLSKQESLTCEATGLKMALYRFIN